MHYIPIALLPHKGPRVWYRRFCNRLKKYLSKERVSGKIVFVVHSLCKPFYAFTIDAGACSFGSDISRYVESRCDVVSGIDLNFTRFGHGNFHV